VLVPTTPAARPVIASRAAHPVLDVIVVSRVVRGTT
jgi:hypothetical protein